jgi:N-acetyl-gamma-glutamyl-phosphate reductase
VKTVAVVGARGYVGAELLPLLDRHPQLQLAWLGSDSQAGQRVDNVSKDLFFAAMDPAVVQALRVDAWVLSLPNGKASAWVAQIDAHQPEAAVIDISADHRFDDGWVYGQPERFRARLRGATRIANPGCYATGAQLAVAPLLPLLSGPPTIFGVSGYSGAGSSPNPRNDVEVLRDNLLPYSLVDHTHERELSRHLGHPVFFSPHVAPFFRGITLTASMPLDSPATWDALAARYEAAYADEPLVSWLGHRAPLVRDIMGRHGVEIGGLEVDPQGRRAVVVATLDNLCKGAATKALQNLNLALGLDELTGIDP